MSQVASPIITAERVPAFFIATATMSGAGFVRLDVGGGRVRAEQVLGVEQLDVVLGILLLRRGREDEVVTALAQLDHQLVGALERDDLVDQLRRRSCASASRSESPCRLLDLVARDRLDELVAAHADVAVDRATPAAARSCSRNARYQAIACW